MQELGGQPRADREPGVDLAVLEFESLRQRLSLHVSFFIIVVGCLVVHSGDQAAGPAEMWGRCWCPVSAFCRTGSALTAGLVHGSGTMRRDARCGRERQLLTEEGT